MSTLIGGVRVVGIPRLQSEGFRVGASDRKVNSITNFTDRDRGGVY